MKLSEAIKKGVATGLPQIINMTFDYEGYKPIAACARGFALLGVHDVIVVTGTRGCPWQLTTDLEGECAMISCPECPKEDPVRATAMQMLCHLNDSHLWKIEKIVALLEEHGA